MKSAKRDPTDEAERFGLATFQPSKGATLSPSEIRAAYLLWCQSNVLDPLPTQKIAPALGSLFRGAGIEVVDGQAIGVAIKSEKAA